jgi:hypothetical protein
MQRTTVRARGSGFNEIFDHWVHEGLWRVVNENHVSENLEKMLLLLFEKTT